MSKLPIKGIYQKIDKLEKSNLLRYKANSSKKKLVFAAFDPIASVWVLIN